SKYIKSYLILLFLTFTELFAGFLILGVENSFVLALVIALVDMLPVLGVGCVLVPWSVILLIGGNIRLGIGLLVLYLIIYLLRQFEEPRIISSQMNVHPLITLFAMYAGLKIAGLGGMIFAPLIAFIIKTVYSSIKKEKSVEKGKEL
ncbi:MAG: AI-2E family transporter, partial [Eubacteriales bacterium]